MSVYLKFGIKSNLRLPVNVKYNWLLELSLSYLLAQNILVSNHSNCKFLRTYPQFSKQKKNNKQ